MLRKNTQLDYAEDTCTTLFPLWTTPCKGQALTLQEKYFGQFSYHLYSSTAELYRGYTITLYAGKGCIAPNWHSGQSTTSQPNLSPQPHEEKCDATCMNEKARSRLAIHTRTHIPHSSYPFKKSCEKNVRRSPGLQAIVYPLGRVPQARSIHSLRMQKLLSGKEEC